ncbi:LysM peptidoglycan-binding domain-containing protein [Parachitinimonas caeni]|uniref:LysM peptidoglycan-binding domain-containing protein n=1 Tax=Parachitinimonas caeni TaxID=3031301 RepID=A0ABT7E3J2_9NEIS|nr:LysM peptidoglycan-binding domain-containing protein [Parachitinimonas caeni]MDK2126885.1 LysM peptidoglycan-binding domain-containing protein [Parachitinimonas caeni]
MSETRYDSQNRMQEVIAQRWSYADNGQRRLDQREVSVQYVYDANGNIRQTTTRNPSASGEQTETQVYAYNHLNLLTEASKVEGVAESVSRIGTKYEYSRSGLRRTSTFQKYEKGKLQTNPDGTSGVTETYTYTGDGQLYQTVSRGYENGNHLRWLDGYGRVVKIHDQSTGQPTDGQINNKYDSNGRLTDQLLGGQHTHYFYHRETGALLRTRTYASYATFLAAREGQPPADNDPHIKITGTTDYRYQWWDSAKEVRVISQIEGKERADALLRYNASGHLLRQDSWSPAVQDPRKAIASSWYYSNPQGQLLHREHLALDEADSHSASLYYSNGTQIGEIRQSRKEGTPSSLIRQSYVQGFNQMVQRGNTEKPATTAQAVTSVDFYRHYQSVNPNNPLPTPGQYTVQAGDTLQDIARNLWGDASLWTMLADSNGLSGSESLSAGRVLTIPNKVINLRHGADSFRPYNPSEALGSLVPANVPVPGADPCGAAQIIMIVIAVIVTIYTAGAASAYFGSAIAGGAVGGAAGAVASQAAGMAMGVQNSFNWNQVGMAALGGAITGGIGQAMGTGASAANGVGTANAAATASSATSNILSTGIRAFAASTLTQGIGSALGMTSFSWRDVAGSTVGAMVGEAVNQGIGNLQYGNNWQATQESLSKGFAEADLFNQASRSLAVNLVNTAVSQKISTGHFSWSNTLPQAVGNTLGDMIKNQVKGEDNRPIRGKAGEQNSAADQDAGRYIYVGGGTSEDFEQDLDEDFGGSFTGAPRRKQPPVAGRLPYGAIAGHAGPAGPVGGYDLSMGITVEAQSLTDYALENDLKLTPTVEHLAAALGRSHLEDVYNYVAVNDYSLAPTPENALRYGLSSRFSAGEPEMYTPGNPVYALENGYTPFEGFFTNEYNKVAAGYRDPNTSALGKIGYGFGATVIAPFMLVEGGGLGLLNAPNNLYVAGQRFVHAVETGNLSQLSMAFLQTGEGIFGLTPLTAIPSKTIALPSRTVTPRVVTPDHMLPDNFVLPENEMLTRMNALRGKYAHLSSEQRLAMRESNAERWVRALQSDLDKKYPGLNPHFVDKHAPDIPLTPNLRQRSIDGAHPRNPAVPGNFPQPSSQFNDWVTEMNVLNESVTRSSRGLTAYNGFINNNPNKPAVSGYYRTGVGRGFTKNNADIQNPNFHPVMNGWLVPLDKNTLLPYTAYPTR